ncbi:MAG TPA: energy transducer TonB [Pedobacter sp.]|jgi:TonB family protein
MLKTSFIVLTLFFCFGALSAQTNETKFYRDHSRTKEVEQKKAKYSETIITTPDGIVTTEFRGVRKNVLIVRSHYKGSEQVGIWYTSLLKEKNLDYSFTIEYVDTVCAVGPLIDKVGNLFTDNSSVNYIAPKLASKEKSVYEFYQNNFKFLTKETKKGVSGEVLTMFTITKDAQVIDIKVLKGSRILLDKEAVRLLRMLKFSSPPFLNGKPLNICCVLPMRFKVK